MKLVSTGIFSFLLFFSIFGVACAELRPNDISAVVTPELPGPNEDLTITLSSYSIDINQALITWKVSGKVQLNGIGKKTFTTKTGAVGTKTPIDVTITMNGSSVTKSVVVEPSELDMLWEAVNTFTPPFYKGKALPASEAEVKVVAQPNIKSGTGFVQSKDMVFTWKRNYTTVQEASGYAKNSFQFKHNYLNDEEFVSVVGTVITTGQTASGLFSLQLSKPQIVFYGISDKIGIWFNRAVNATSDIGKDTTALYAAPYSFSPKNTSGNQFSFSWAVGGQSATSGSARNILPVTMGTKKISLKIESITKLFQNAQKTIN